MSAPGGRLPAEAEIATGLALMTGAMLVLPGLDVIAKLLMARLPPDMVATGRFFVQSAVLLPIVLWAGQMGRPTGLQAVAGLFLGLALLCINLALREMPVATVLAIFFVEPLLLTLMAAAVLGERLGWRRLAGIAVGFAGTLLVLKPNLAEHGAVAAWPLAAAGLFAVYMLTTRRMTRTGGRLALQFWTGVFAMATLAGWTAAGVAVGGPAPPIPGGRELALFAAMGCLAAAGHAMIVAALSRIEAGAAAPLQYLEIVSGSLLGWAVFGDLPGSATWAGTALIVGAGVYVARRERRVAARGPAPPAGR